MPPRRRARAPSLPPVRLPGPQGGFAPAGHFVDRVTLVAFGVETFIAAVDAVTVIVLINLVVVGPLIAAFRTGPRQTAAIAAYALALGIAEGVPHGILGSPDHIVRCTAIAVTGALAVWGSGLRVRREAAERREAFLGEAGTLLSGSLDFDATLRMVTEIAVPALADGVRVDVGEEDGAVRRVAAGAEAHDDVRAAIDRVLAGGAPELHAAAGDAGARSLIVVPMAARGRTFGAITLVAPAGARPFDDTDLETAEELARRSALAVDNARLYGQTSRIARALQDSLLPSRIPSIPGLRLATRFLAAGEGVDVGGDFLDVFEASDGRWAVVIGDVMGKGPEAAAVTALARYTIRATAVTAQRPSDVLRALNDALLRQLADERRFCTAAIAYVTPGDGGGGAGVLLASAGHPLPMRVGADGAVAPAGEHGMVLGIERTPPLPDSELELGPGDKLVFFTDGVIEARHDGRMLGSAGLASVLEGCAGAPPAAIAARVQAAATAQGPPRDDLAVLVLETLTRAPARGRERSASSTA